MINKCYPFDIGTVIIDVNPNKFWRIQVIRGNCLIMKFIHNALASLLYCCMHVAGVEDPVDIIVAIITFKELKFHKFIHNFYAVLILLCVDL